MLATAQTNNQWFVLRGDDKYGPFQYNAMIRMLQKNELFEYNYVWAPHLETWTLLGELQDFSRDRLARLIENNDEMKNAFTQRGCERANVIVPVYGHNEYLLFDGQTLSVSENGALLLLNSPLLLPNQQVLLHFRTSELNSVPFNATATIVRKNFHRSRINVKSGLHYAVRFVEVSEAGKTQLKDLVKDNTKEAK